VSLCVILLKLKLWVLSEDLIYYRNNDSTVGSFIYCLPVFLLKQASMPAILSTYWPPKHSSNLPLVTVLYIILVIHFLFANFACNPYTCVSSRLCLCFITPENLIPLLVCPINMLLCLFKSLLSILLRKGALPSRNPTCIALLFKCCTYSPFPAIQSKDSWYLNPWRFAILTRGCCPLN
jgi:hypothetical protein